MACDYPRKVKTADYPVPCNRCASCLQTRISNWSFRLMQEYKVSETGYFVTLTYDTMHVPISANGFMNLDKRHLQLFFKKIRKYHANKKLKYYAAGEYGTTRNRPHYHIILFNADLRLCFSVSDYNLLRATKFDGKTHVQFKGWEHGTASIGQLTQASVGYTLKYINKKYFKPKHQNDDRQKEFALMSKGLGAAYLSPAIIRWHKSASSHRCYVNIDNGKKASMPRYYKEKIFTPAEISAAGDVHRQRLSDKFKQITDVIEYSRQVEQAAIMKQKNHKLNLTKDDKF